MRVLSLALILLAGCPKRGESEDPQDLLARHLERVDAAWARRGEAGFPPVHEALTEAELALPAHPEIAWRWARFDVGLGLAAEDRDEARHHFGEARGAALSCLLSNPVFDARQAEIGWDAALEALPEDRTLCAVWTAFAWLRWMEQIGARAAEIDFERIHAIIDHLRLEGVDPDGRVTWSRGLAQTLEDRADGLSSPRGRALLSQAVDVRPGELTRTVDLLLLTDAEISGEAEDALEAALRVTADTPEDRRARTRLLALQKSESGG